MVLLGGCCFILVEYQVDDIIRTAGVGMFALLAQHLLAIRLILAKAHGDCHLLCYIVGVVGQPMLVEEVRIAVFQAWDRCGVDEWDMKIFVRK